MFRQARIKSFHRRLGMVRRPKGLDFTGVDLAESSKSAPAIDQPHLRLQMLYCPVREKYPSFPAQDYSPEEDKPSTSPSPLDYPIEQQQMIYIPRSRSFTK